MVCCEFAGLEETYDFATSIYGICNTKKKSHVFGLILRRLEELFGMDFFGNARVKPYAVNYHVAAIMQVMGCGNSDVATLTGFLDLPTSWSVVSKHMRDAEKVVWPIKIT